MSSESPSLAGLAVLFIILATTAGTEGDVAELLGISITPKSSISPATPSPLVADRQTTRENGTNEITSSDVAEHSTAAKGAAAAAERDALETPGDAFDGWPTNRPDFPNSPFNPAWLTKPISKIKTSTALLPEEVKDDVSSRKQTRQERLASLADNATNQPPTRGTTTGGPSFLRDEPATFKVELMTRPLESPRPPAESTTSAITGRPVVTSSEVGKAPGSKSRNDLIGGNFHEIKLGQKVNSKSFGYSAKKLNVPSVLGKYAPYFEDELEELNVTARIGSSVLLDCKIGMLGNKTVTWSYHNGDVFRLLTVDRNAYSVDQRISLFFKYPTNWRLRIQYATPRDSGLYECQVATYPPLVKKIHLLVTAPILEIMDDSGKIKSGERHLKAGSSLRLRCEARDVPEQYNETVIWTRGDEILSEDVSENKTTDFLDGREIQVIISTIVVEKATPRHAGNYSCVVPEKAKATVAVHVLNGELPAAVHDGNGVSRSVLNLWLIHLTVSYVFSR